LIEQGLTSPPTQYRLSGRQFYRSKDPTNSIKVLKEKRYKSEENSEKANNTKYSKTIKRHTHKKHSKSLVYTSNYGVTRVWLPQRAGSPSDITV